MDKDKGVFMTAREVNMEIEMLKTVFDIVRLVDVSRTAPVNIGSDDCSYEAEHKCFAVWNKGRRCENCISAKVFARKNKMTKFEFVNDDIYQVIAKYVVIDGTPLVMEMVFKMTDKIFLVPAIKIKSPGPAFFSQVRMGKNGRPFKIYKFRSMYMDAEERKKELMKQNNIKDGMMFKMDDDPRIIKGVGHFIRKTSLDEFPQFWNILKGDMSLVGTRPPTMDEWEKYELHHRKRLAIKPGLTGMWQVSGRSDITDFEEVVELDTKYIAEWCLKLDIEILVKTVMVVFRGSGAK